MLTIYTSHGTFRARSVASGIRTWFGKNHTLATPEQANRLTGDPHKRLVIKPVTYPQYPGQIERVAEILKIEA